MRVPTSHSVTAASSPAVASEAALGAKRHTRSEAERAETRNVASLEPVCREKGTYMRALSTLRGLRGAPEVPPLCRETQSLGQQMCSSELNIYVYLYIYMYIHINIFI